MKEPTSIRIRRPDDWHVHLRQDDILYHVIGETASLYARALVMPNTKPGIYTGLAAERYRTDIRFALPAGHPFTPYMTIKVTEQTDAETLFQANRHVLAGKIYPLNVTHHADDGVKDFLALDDIYAAAAEIGLPLCFHGEMPGAYCHDAEAEFMPQLFTISKRHPRLKIILEHITTRVAVDMVKMLPNVAATITAHHPFLTLNDLIGGRMRPHNFCMPFAKRPTDRDALIGAMLSGNPKFFLGTDSAPHVKGTKECGDCCAGVFVPGQVAMGLLTELFLEHNAIHRLEPFVSQFGAEWYGLPLSTDEIEIVREDWFVPRQYGDIVPFKERQRLKWQVHDAYLRPTAL